MLRIFNVVWVALMIAGAVFTYVMKDRAGRAADHVAQLRADIAHQKDVLNVQQAEWAVLDQPARLQALVTRYSSYLGLVPIDVRQFVAAAEIPVKPPVPIDALVTGSTKKPAETIASLSTKSVGPKP